MTAQVVSVNISERKGTPKHTVAQVQLKPHHGIVGDAHAGNWHRQISLLAEESINKMRRMRPQLEPGIFAENINTAGIDLKDLPVGTRLRIGDAEVEVTRSARSATRIAPSKKPLAAVSCQQRASLQS